MQEYPHLFQMPLVQNFHCRSLSRLLSIFLETKQVLPGALQALFHLGARDLLLALWALLVWWVCDLNQWTFLFNSLPWLQELRLRVHCTGNVEGPPSWSRGPNRQRGWWNASAALLQINTAVNAVGSATGNDRSCLQPKQMLRNTKGKNDRFAMAPALGYHPHCLAL